MTLGTAATMNFHDERDNLGPIAPLASSAILS
jgi:hypothetical protein